MALFDLLYVVFALIETTIYGNLGLRPNYQLPNLCDLTMMSVCPATVQHESCPP